MNDNEIELFDHQKIGVDFLKKTRKAILADEMGLGKTRQAIVASGESSNGKTMIICPASLKVNWEREIHMVYPEDTVKVINSGQESEIGDETWVVINYDILETHQEKLIGLFKHGGFETLIIDEAHYIKGNSNRADSTIKIAKLANQVYCLTGTPMMNRPIELFNLLKAIEHPLSKGKMAYSNRYCGGQMKTRIHDLYNNKMFFVNPDKAFPFRRQRDRYKVYTYMDSTGATRIDELRQQIKGVMMRREKKNELNLPPKIKTEFICELDNEWKSKYDSAWDRYLEWVESNPEMKNIENILTAQHLIELGKLKQVCSMAKVDRIVNDVENIVEQGEKVIVFSQFTNTINELRDKINKKRIGVVTLTGDDDIYERQESVDKFQKDDDTKVFVANMKAAGVGLNLTSASIVIFADMDWSPAVHDQAEDRAHRIGQKGTVNVYYYIIKDTVEEYIKGIVEGKTELIGKLQGKLPTVSLDNN